MRTNRIAVGLMWFWGLMLLAGGVAIGYPALVVNGNAIILVGFLFVGALYGVAGYALRKRVWGVRWWGSLLCATMILILALAQMLISLLGIAVNLAVLVCIGISWRFDPKETGV